MALKVRLSSLTRAIYSHYCGFISALAHGFLSSDAFLTQHNTICDVLTSLV